MKNLQYAMTLSMHVPKGRLRPLFYLALIITSCQQIIVYGSTLLVVCIL